MKIFCVFFVLLTFSVQAQVKRILFIGNSYTYVNNLPQMLQDLALSGGDSIFFDSSAPGGYTFQQHVTNSITLSKIAQGNWDYVILQEQSQRPSFPPSQVAVEVFPYARMLDSLIYAADSCAETVFYMTWGRKYGDQTNCGAYPPVCTFEGMQLRLRDSYLQMGNDNQATIAPAGMAWRASRNADSTVELYSADYSHPSTEGTYLTACVFYSTLFKKDPTGLSFTASLPSSTATFLQQIAYQTVSDSITLWNVDIDHPAAGFGWNIVSGNTVSFTDTSVNSSSSLWTVDGQLYSSGSFIHNFPGAGVYPVTLVASNGCFTDTLAITINVNVSGVDENVLMRPVVSPNPANNVISVTGLHAPFNYSITDLSGKKVAAGRSDEKIPVDFLVPGFYLLIPETIPGSAPVKFVKEK